MRDSLTGQGPAMAGIRVLLFDLGGVLVEFSGVRDIAPLLSQPASPAEIVERWGRCPHARAFGRGELEPDDYVERFARDWGITLEPARFGQEFRSWSRGLYPGAKELLDELRPRFRLAALSNSNALHWDRNTREIGVTDLFELAISSHQVGLIKPDPAIFRLALDRLGVAADAVMFFDDSAENVRVAASVGMRAFQVDGVDGVRRCLEQQRLL